MVSDVEIGVWGDVRFQVLRRSFGVERSVAVDNEVWMPGGIVLERILNVIRRDSSVDKITGIEVANIVLFEDIIDIFLIVDGENFPIGINDAANSTKNHLTTRMIWDPISDIVDLG